MENKEEYNPINFIDINTGILEEYIPKYFDKLTSNLIGLIFQYFEHNEILNYCRINKKFKKAMNSESLWEEMTLREDLFAQMNNVKDQSTWKKYYFNLCKLKKNFKSGKSNASFKMKPMRGHLNYITSMNYYENTLTKYSSVISGDKNGVVNYWSYNKDDEEYVANTIIKMNEEIVLINIDYTMKILVLVDKSGNVYSKIIFIIN
jgi:hypothetical protein